MVKADERRLHQAQGVERIVDFSNGVMGFAITLLVVDIRLPVAPSLAGQLHRELLSLWPQYVAYVISFYAIGENWIIYNRIFSHIVRVDERLYWLNLLFLFFIAFLPFPTSLVSAYPAQKLPVLLYAGVIISVVFSRTLLWWYAAHNHRLVHETLDPSFIRRTLVFAVILLTGFIASSVLAFFSPLEAIDLWILMGLYSLLTRTRIYLSQGK